MVVRVGKSVKCQRKYVLRGALGVRLRLNVAQKKKMLKNAKSRRKSVDQHAKGLVFFNPGGGGAGWKKGGL